MNIRTFACALLVALFTVLSASNGKAATLTAKSGIIQQDTSKMAKKKMDKMKMEKKMEKKKMDKMKKDKMNKMKKDTMSKM